ncbi:hypothetical protein J6TS7_19090 [Paenibacillus dendritiformis]|nr:hypothetical protein J6TS7_19090 [Paenibacillus dendritiformis]
MRSDDDNRSKKEGRSETPNPDILGRSGQVPANPLFCLRVPLLNEGESEAKEIEEVIAVRSIHPISKARS